ncbi:DNA modification methylase [Candidatus Pacearchaeota archaeon RBG_13_36_9]|nr:MAG: DNA modification methylase [Candidatus Pacearchaeota archaeon RBG_13_36_9]
MKFVDLVNLYEEKKKKYGVDTYKHISELLEEAKILHKKDWEKHPTKKKDHEQSWKGFKGSALERLILYVLEDAVQSLGLKIISGKKFERTYPKNLSLELKQVKKNLAIDYGKFGFHLPDVDLVIYNPKDFNVLAVLSSKSTLRERIAQTGYWNLKIKNDALTKHVKVFFLTLDEDGTLTKQFPTKKGRAIVEIDTDGSYVLSKTKIEESNKVKMFDKFIEDLKKLLN